MRRAAWPTCPRMQPPRLDLQGAGWGLGARRLPGEPSPGGEPLSRGVPSTGEHQLLIQRPSAVSSAWSGPQTSPQTRGLYWTGSSCSYHRPGEAPTIVGCGCPQASFSGAAEVVLGGGDEGGTPAVETPLFISASIWFLRISFNKPVLTHEPRAGAGLGRGPLPRESGAGPLGPVTISALSCREEERTRNFWRAPPSPGTGAGASFLASLAGSLTLQAGSGAAGPWRSKEHPHPGWRSMTQVWPGPSHSGNFQ